jgi:CheY-like chemotaxis protein
MPLMDGYEATRALRQSGYAGIIIAITAAAMTSDREKCIEVGCDDYGQKPIRRQELLLTIKEHLEKKIGR